MPLHLAQRHRGSRLLRPLPRQQRGAGKLGLRSCAQGASQGDPDAGGRISGREIPAARDQGEARCRGVRANPSGSGATGAGSGRTVAPSHCRVLSRRRADQGAATVPGGRSATAIPLGDDGGGTIGAEYPRPRHGGDLRRPLRQRGRARAERAAPALPRRQRDPADGGAGTRSGSRRPGLHPQRPPPGLRAIASNASRIPAGGRRGTGSDYLCRHRSRCQRSRPASRPRSNRL